MVLLVVCGVGGAAEPPADAGAPLWGQGLRSCDDYARAWVGAEQGQETGIAEYRRFRDWLTGFVSGLNLATGGDVLAGADPEGAMRRIQLYCDEHRKEDFFTAVVGLVRELSQLR
jgi:hypothetical protein